jgi:hypothetical protein
MQPGADSPMLVRAMRAWSVLFALAPLLAATAAVCPSACTSQSAIVLSTPADAAITSGTGGSPGIGGTTGTGGTTRSGGITGTAGTTAGGTGGVTGAGGTTRSSGTGGAPVTGGAPGTGGAIRTGGTTGSGGATGTGGATRTGGTTSTGGTLAGGGATGAGGLTGTGGTAGGTSTSTPTNLLFQDDFGAGYELHWRLSGSEDTDGPVSNGTDGTNRIVTLDASANDYSRLRCNLTGDLFANPDVTASMRFRVELAPTSTRTVRLDVRQAADTENIFYAVGATIATDGSITKVGIFKKVDDGSGGYTICSLAQTSLATPVTMGQWRTIKLAISGTTSVHLVAFYEDAQVATSDDDCTSPLTSTAGEIVPNGGCLADQTGLGIQVEKGTKASVDDVLVTKLP